LNRQDVLFRSSVLQTEARVFEWQDEFLKNKIAAAFAANELEPHLVEDVAFHMTDWKDDLDQLVTLYQNIDRASDSEIQKVIIGFLAHAPNHIVAARKERDMLFEDTR